MTSHHPLVELFIWVKNVLLNLTPEKIEDYVLHGPEYYYKWWMNLLRENPNHVIIETILFSFIIWLLFIRKTIDPTKESKTKLTQKEIDWLVETWEPEPLVPVCEEEVIPLPVRVHM